jgi:precorrin-6Y C5,15-methyltransferase (decarboxylating)
VGTLEMISSTYAALKRLGGQVDVLLLNLSRGVEQLESLRFEAVNPTVLMRIVRGE